MAKISFIDKIKSFKQIQPTASWQVDLRQQLLIEKKTQDLFKQDFDFRASAMQGLFSFLKQARGVGFLWRPAIIFLIILGVFGLGLGGLALASQNSLPGEGLYVVKTAVEQARLALVKDTEGRVKIQAELTDKRIQELNKIIMQEMTSLDKKKERTELAVNQLNQQLISLKDQLPKVENEGGKEKALAVAQKVIEKSGKAEEAVSAVKERSRQEGLLNESQILQKIAEVLKTADKTGAQALKLMVENKEQDDLLTQRVTERIQQTEGRIKLVDDGLNNDQILAKLFDKATIMKEQTNRAKEVLILARKDLDENNLSGAVEKTESAKDLFLGAQETIEILAIIIENEKDVSATGQDELPEDSPIKPATGAEDKKTYPTTTEPQKFEIQSTQLLSL